MYRRLIAGDLNIAPYEEDVWSHKQLLKVVSHTPVETDLFEKTRETLGYTDTMRRHVAMEEKLYTWWSYRAKDWAASNRGRRLDQLEGVGPDGEHGVLGAFVLAQGGADARQQHRELERLGDIVVRACIQPQNGIAVGGMTGQHDHRAGHVALAHQAAHFAAVHVGQADIFFRSARAVAREGSSIWPF
jgi:hypothetical protein